MLKTLIGIVLGAILTGAFKIGQDLHKRNERIKDFQIALRAEIRSELYRYKLLNLDSHLDTIITNINNSSKVTYTPFVPREPNTLIFSKIAKDVYILPEDVIDPVVLYYKQLSTISQFIDDLRSDRFSQLDARRKIAMYTDYISMMKRCVELAQDAHRALDESLAEKPFNTPASAPSDLDR